MPKECIGSAKIFIVEDSVDTVMILTNYLSSTFKCDLTIAKNGDEAIAILKETQGFDLIICDYQMHPGNGLDVLNFMKVSAIDIPFIFYSGMASELTPYKSGICRAVVEKMDVKSLTKAIGELVCQHVEDD